MSPVLQTDRLSSFPFSQMDFGTLVELHSDREVMRYLSDDGGHGLGTSSNKSSLASSPSIESAGTGSSAE